MSHEHNSLSQFKAYREKMNEKILKNGGLAINRFFNLDNHGRRSFLDW